MKLSLIIPCYNEQDNLKPLLEVCKREFTSPDVEVILVNNGSTDNSADILSDILPNYPFARSVTVEENQGYGYGILAGLKTAKASYVGWTHADLQANPCDAITALDYIEKSNQPLYIKGKRYGRSFSDLFFSVGMSLFETMVLRTPLWDINAQPNIFPREFFESWKNPPYDFALDIYVYAMAKKNRLMVKRFPVFFGRRKAGEAHLKNLPSKIKYAIKMIKYTKVLRTYFKE